ncbi:MAG: dihydroorotate dehydrogenase [Candidatus Bathyarchaeota archaeon]|nr:dihydroorotate dehydrogenase [Candidatus Bathyarchaeota archaeon]
MSQLSLAVDLAGLRLRNPTLNAAGVLGISSTLLKRVYEAGAGAVVTKSIGPGPRPGHPNPTVASLEGGLLNAMGLPNPGASYFAGEIMRLKEDGVPVVASFFGASVEEFVEAARVLAEAGADALELNCSCPNVEEEMGTLGADPANVERITSSVRRAVDTPIFVKLTPNVADIVEVARAAERGGADAVTAVNTLKALAVDIELRRPVLANVTGGLSGPALKPVALRCVWEIAEAVDIPVIGCGGVSDWRDAVEFLLCGASAVEIGTAVMTRGLEIFRDVSKGIRGYLGEHGFREVGEIVGLAHEG